MVSENRKAESGKVIVHVNAFDIEVCGLTCPENPGVFVVACSGEIFDSGNKRFQKGQRVIAVTEMGTEYFRWDNLEYISVPEAQVLAANSELSFRELASVPESFLSVWHAFCGSMKLSTADTLLVRGAERAAGNAAVQIAKAMGCKVIAATKNPRKMPLFTDVEAAVLDMGNLSEHMPGVTKVIDLRDERVFLDMIADLPGQCEADEMFAFMRKHELRPEIEKLYEIADVEEAIDARNSGSIDGKIIVVNYEEEDEDTTNWINDLADLFG